MSRLHRIKRLGQIGLAATALTLAATGTSWAAKVNIGFTGPLSGGAALYGQDTLEGLKMATREINSNGGIKVNGKQYDINLISLDDKYLPSQSAVNGKRLVQQDNTPVVFVPHSGGTFALQAFNERDKFLIMSYTSIPEVTGKGNKLTVKIPPNFTDYIEPFVKLEMKRFGPRLAIANATHDYAKYWTKAFVPAWKKAGGTVVADDPMDYNNSADFYTGVSKALSKNPDVLFVGGASEPTGLVIKQARELGFKGGFAIMDQAKLPEVARVAGGMDKLEGAVGVAPLPYLNTPGAKHFVNLYKKNHNDVPTAESAYNYFAMYLVARAMEIANTVTDATAIRAAIPQALNKISDKHNAFGVKNIAKDGNLAIDVELAEVKNGKVRIFRKSDMQ